MKGDVGGSRGGGGGARGKCPGERLVEGDGNARRVRAKGEVNGEKGESGTDTGGER